MDFVTTALHSNFLNWLAFAGAVWCADLLIGVLISIAVFSFAALTFGTHRH